MPKRNKPTPRPSAIIKFLMHLREFRAGRSQYDPFCRVSAQMPAGTTLWDHAKETMPISVLLGAAEHVITIGLLEDYRYHEAYSSKYQDFRYIEKSGKAPYLEIEGVSRKTGLTYRIRLRGLHS